MNYSNYTSIVNILHDQIRNDNKPREHRDCCKFYPSSAGNCARAIVYQMIGCTPKEKEVKMYFILDNGNYVHSRLEKLFENTGLMIAPELSIRVPELRISGRSDVIIKNFLPHTPSTNIVKLYKPCREGEPELVYEGPDNDVIIVELKSISDSGFEYVKKKGPKEAHVLQLQLYMWITGVKQGALLYENKNTQELREYLIPYDPETAQKVIDKVHLVNKCVDDGTLPPKEFDKSDLTCRWCDYFNICWPSKQLIPLEKIL